MPTTYKRSFKAGPSGDFPPGTTLRPAGVYVLQEEQPVAKPLANRDQLVGWIQRCVLGDLRTLRIGIAHYLSDEQALGAAGLAGANFLLAAGCCNALEYFARIFHGTSNSVDNVRAYAARFLKDPRYQQVAGMLQRVLRNGLVHGSWPKVFCLESDKENRILVGVSAHPNDPHLTPVPAWTGNSLAINSTRFLDDLHESVASGFASWIRDEADDGVLERGAPGLLLISDGDDLGRNEFQQVLEWNRLARGSG